MEKPLQRAGSVVSFSERARYRSKEVKRVMSENQFIDPRFTADNQIVYKEMVKLLITSLQDANDPEKNQEMTAAEKAKIVDIARQHFKMNTTDPEFVMRSIKNMSEDEKKILLLSAAKGNTEGLEIYKKKAEKKHVFGQT